MTGIMEPGYVWSPWRWGAEISLLLLPLNTRSGYILLAVISPQVNGACSCAEGGRQPVRGGSDGMREAVRKGGYTTATAKTAKLWQSSPSPADLQEHTHAHAHTHTHTNKQTHTHKHAHKAAASVAAT